MTVVILRDPELWNVDILHVCIYVEDFMRLPSVLIATVSDGFGVFLG